jgi:hypothetical protein
MSGGRVFDPDPTGGRTPGAQPAPSIGAPWFVQFWPVFIAVLMGLSIAASLVTVVIAHRHADEDVRLSEPSEAAPAPARPPRIPAGTAEPSR